jgi:hypothetical protein
MLELLDIPVKVAAAPAGAATHAAHLPALLALLYLPIALIAFLVLCDLAARGGFRPAASFLQRFAGADFRRKAFALSLLVTAAIHLGLIPGHLDVDPVRSLLFALDAVAMIALAGWALTLPAWQPAGIFLLAANLGLYGYYVANGWEAVEPIGIFAKLVELAAIGLAAATLPLRITKLRHTVRRLRVA